MKKLLALLLLCGSAFAQNTLTSTTLGQAITASQQTFTLASLTGVTVDPQTYLFVDLEAMRVISISGSYVTVTRGASSTRALAHANGAVVLIGRPTWFFTVDPSPQACAANQIYVTPYVNMVTGVQWVCDTSGVWFTKTVGISTLNVGTVNSTNTNASTVTAGTASLTGASAGVAGCWKYFGTDGITHTDICAFDSGGALTINGPVSISSNYFTENWTAGAGGVSPRTLVSLNTVPRVVTSAAGATDAIGIAVGTAASGAPVEVAIRGRVACVADNNTTADNLVIVGTTTPGSCRDAGTTDINLIPKSTQVMGRMLTSVSGGAAASIELFGPGVYGAYRGTSGGTSVVTATINDTADHNLMCIGVPGAALNTAGKTIRLVGYGDHNSGTGTPVMVYKFKAWTDAGCTAGAATLFVFPANTVDVTGLTNEGWSFDGLITTILTGASGSLRPQGRMDVTFSNAANPQTRVNTTTADSTFDLTASTVYFSIVASATSGGSATAQTRQTIGAIYPVN